MMMELNVLIVNNSVLHVFRKQFVHSVLVMEDMELNVNAKLVFMKFLAKLIVNVKF